VLDPNALVEAEVLYDGSIVSCGGIKALLIVARPLQHLIFIKIVRLAKNLFLNSLSAMDGRDRPLLN
jgi:hypothetical protein